MIRRIIVGMTLVFLSGLVSIGHVAHAQSTDAIITEWSLAVSGSSPFQIDASGCIAVFTSRFVTGQLNATTNTLTEWGLPVILTSPGDIAIHTDSSGNRLVYVTDINGFASTFQIGQLNPATNLFTEWTLPSGVTGGPRGFAIDASDNVFFSASSRITGHFIGRLDPSTNTFSIWAVPEALAIPDSAFVGDVTIDQSGRIFFIVTGSPDRKIGRLDPTDPTTNTFTEWALPSLRQASSTIEADSLGNIFFQEVFSGLRAVARLVPSTNTLTEWQFSGNPSEFISVDSFNEMFFSRVGQVVTRLDPSVLAVDTVLVSKTLMPTVSPSVTVVTPSTITITPTTSTITPTITTVTGLVDGPFTEWTVPTAGSGVRGISADVSSVFFGEQGANKIGRLVTIQTAVQALKDLIADVMAENLVQGISNSLVAKLEAALEALDDLNQENDVAAINERY